MGFEMIGGRYVELHGNNTFTYALIANCEETLTLVGMVLLEKHQTKSKDSL